jgi:hypothetical protein
MTNYNFARENKQELSTLDIAHWEEVKLELWADIKSRLVTLNHPDWTKYKAFSVTVGPLRGGAMPGYWVLISVLQDYMIGEGNQYLEDNYGTIYNVNIQERLSDWVKVEAGHCEVIKVKGRDYAEPRSIAYKSDCTWQDMKKLLDFLLRFGQEHGIIGLELKAKDEDKIKKGFGE